jgi:disulfide bond formation protein DsbB
MYVGLMGCDALWTCRYIPAFRRNILPPSSDQHRHFHHHENLMSRTQQLLNESQFCSYWASVTHGTVLGFCFYEWNIILFL